MIEELRRFILAANEGNLTRTAQNIFITQSALTQSIHRLEKEIGAKIFVQRGKYLELTADGKALKSMGEKILELWSRAKDPKLRESFRPTINIGMFDNAALRLGSFVKENTLSNKFDLEFTIDNSGKLLSNLQLGVIDIAILVKKNNPYPKEIVCLKEFEEEMVPVSGRIYDNEIEKTPFILFNKGSNTREQTDLIFTERGIRPKVFAESTSPAFMKELAILNCGVALLPENLIKQELKQKMLFKQSFSLKWKREYGIFVHMNTKSAYIDQLVREISIILQRK